MTDIEAFVVAYGAPTGLALWILVNSWRQAKSGGSETLFQKIDKLNESMASLRERVAALEAVIRSGRNDGSHT